MPSTLRAFMALILAFIRGRVLTVTTRSHGPMRLHVRSLRVFPVAAGADDDPPDDPDDPPDDDPDDDPDDPPDDDPETWDKARAARTIKEQRKAEKRLKAERDAEKARADTAAAKLAERDQADETESQKVVRERDEARLEAQAARDRADRLAIDGAVRDAALEADVHPRRVRRLLRLVDRDDIKVADDGTITGADEAVADVLEDFPEFKADPNAAPDDDPEKPKREPPGGGPDRKRKPKPLTADQVAKLAKDNPADFNKRYEAGEFAGVI